MILEGLTNLIYKLLILIFLIAIVSTTVYYFILKISKKHKGKKNNNNKKKSTKNSSCNNSRLESEERILRVIELDKTPKDIIVTDTEQIKELKEQASQLLSSKMKNKQMNHDDVEKLKNFITKATGKKRGKRHKNDLHFIYSTIKHYDLTETTLLKIIYFLKGKEAKENNKN